MTLRAEVNERLTRVGPGTPAGKMLRRYWQPIAAASELDDKPVRKVRVLGEDLVLYRDAVGEFGLLAEQCPHRLASLNYGIPEAGGLRCPYHGWLFDRTGQCLEQPNEPENSTFHRRIRTAAYPVQELGGLLFAYLGPGEPPLLPRFDVLVQEGGYRSVGTAVLPCNWLQIMENSVDPVHAEWLHGKYFDYIQHGFGQEALDLFAGRPHHVEIGFDVFEYGIIKRRVLEGGSREDEAWAVGHPLIFPNLLKVGGGGVSEFQYRVPVDDTHTLHIWYTLYEPPGGVPTPQTVVPHFRVPYKDENDEFIVDFIPGQDIMAWVTQGSVTDRTREHLGQTDKGVILFRRLLQEQIQLVERDEDPLGTVRDPDHNVRIDLPLEKDKFLSGEHALKELKGKHARYNPHYDDIVRLFGQTASA
ncbi:MAG: Rieske 2Fe-2S domain-containing protein [Nitriliruptorales bacterium]|nr:Rieske 2Fe-2S domain-containing protein [Nitriliruptorales bacterium]